MWLSQEFGGTGEKGHLFQGNKGTKAKTLGEEGQYWGTGNIRKHLEGGGKQVDLFQGNNGTKVF